MEWLRRARLAGAIVTWAMVAAACAGSEGIAPGDVIRTSTTSATSTTSSGATVAPQSIYGGTVVVGVADGGSPRGLNPFLEGPDSPVLDLLVPAVFAQGFDTDPVTGERIPDALAALPSLSDGTVVDNGDGTMSVTVALVEGAKWADGTPMTGADLEFTARIASDPDVPIRPDIAAAYEAIVPGSFRTEGGTVTFLMGAGSDPAALFEMIIPRHAVEASDFAGDWNDELWVSGGPFVLTDWEPGSFVELSRNDEYWKVTAAEGASLPFLDRVVVRFFDPGPEIDIRLVEGFERGDLDVVVFDRAEERSADFGDSIDAGAVLESVESGEWDHLNFQFGPANRNERSLNMMREFRLAVVAAIDREALAADRGTVRLDTILGTYLPGAGTDPWAEIETGQDRIDALLYDIEVVTGRDMFAGDGPEVVVTVASDVASTVALAGEIVSMLREAGIGAQLQLEGSELFFGSTFDNGSWDLSTWRIGAGDGLGDALRFFRIYDPDGLPFVGDNYFRWGTVDSTVSNAATRRYGEIIDEISETVDPGKMLEMLVEAEQILASEMIVLPLIVSHLEGTISWPTAVIGVEANSRQGVLWNVDTWRRPTA
jgi:ABC-type transport system substrate-binding protein